MPLSMIETNRSSAVTGQDSPRDRELATKAGANEYYVKPLGLKSLDRAIGRYFDASS